MIVLGIETTCDETAASIVVNGKKILSNIVASSADIHRKYGGVFPELACRRHIEVIEQVTYEAIKQAEITFKQIDLIAVAKGPGLLGALLIGMNFAKGLAISSNKPFIGINHLEAHLYASMMTQETFCFPALGVCLSGGHTFLTKILNIGCYRMISATVDDAIGEAFDKIAKLLNLPYPGGPEIERLAKEGNPNAFSFKAGKVKKRPLDFSFSGLKTNVLYTMQKEETQKQDVAASFQEVAFKDVANKTLMASKTFNCKSLYFGGGVTANLRLREIIEQTLPHLQIFWPPFDLSLDNAAMIAGLAAKKYIGSSNTLDLEVQTRIPIA